MVFYEQMLYGVQGLVLVIGNIDCNQFCDYVDVFNLDVNFFGIQVIVIEEWVLVVQLDVYLFCMVCQGVVDYKICLGGSCIVYVLIILCEFYVGCNCIVFGNDQWVDLVWCVVMEKVCDLGMVIIFGKIELSNEGLVIFVFMMYLLLYECGKLQFIIVECCVSLIGWVYVVFWMSDVIVSLYGENSCIIVFMFYDGVIQEV